MAEIGKVTLEIFEGPPAAAEGFARVHVFYRISPTHHDAEHGQAYTEKVQLVGDDRGPGEDGQSELIPGGVIWDGVIRFTTSTQPYFDQSHERHDVPISILDEDQSGLHVLGDEIRALVTLTPIAQEAVSAESNLIERGGVVGPQTLSKEK